MAPGAQGIIERLQPFTIVPGTGQGAPETHPLAVLHVLDIADKHRILLVTLGGVGGDSITGLPFESEIESTGPQPWRDGAELGRVRLPGRASRLGGVQYHPHFDVYLGEPPLREALLMWVADEVITRWITDEVMTPLLPYARR